jgi:hypothetical protein
VGASSATKLFCKLQLFFVLLGRKSTMMLSANLKPYIVQNLHQLFIKTYVETDSSLAKKQYKQMAQALLIGSPVWEISEIRDLALESASCALPENFVGIIEQLWEEIV